MVGFVDMVLEKPVWAFSQTLPRHAVFLTSVFADTSTKGVALEPRVLLIQLSHFTSLNSSCVNIIIIFQTLFGSVLFTPVLINDNLTIL